MRRFYSIFAISTISLLLSQVGMPLSGQSTATGSSALLDHVTAFTSLPNGIEVRDGEARETIVALRDDLLRIRIARRRGLPEDASWAVLADARHSSVPATPEIAADHVGFRTNSLSVEIDRKSLALTIRDLSGNVLQQDARPVRFRWRCLSHLQNSER